MSKGSNVQTTNQTSTTRPPPEVERAYQDIMRRAQTVSEKPYQQFGGEFVAPINQQQQAGIANINRVGEGFAPVAGQAGQFIAQGAAPVTASDIAQYMDPYTGQVIEATQADFDVQNQRANTMVRGQAAAQNALGGNRVGVAEALTQEAQGRTQAPIIAGLRSAGFRNAEEMANAQKARQIAGGAQLASAAGQAAGQQVGAGTLEQQTRQAQDTAALQEHFRQQGYDFQTAQWLAQVALATGSQMGATTTGTGTTTGPTPNVFSQIAGLGLAGFGMFRADGGAVEGFAEGGAPGGPWSEGVGWVPTAGAPRGTPLQAARLDLNPTAKSQPGLDTEKAGKGLGALAKWGYDKWNTFDSTQNEGVGLSADDINPSMYAAGGGVRRGFADGGVPISLGLGSAAFDDRFGDIPPPDYSGRDTRLLHNQLLNEGYNSPLRTSPDVAADIPEPIGTPPMGVAGLEPRPVQTISFPRPDPIARAIPGLARDAVPMHRQLDDGELPEGVLAYNRGAVGRGAVSIPRVGPGSAPRGVAAEPAAAGEERPGGLGGLLSGFGLPKVSDEARQGLISMGLAMMANRHGGPGSFLASMGEGGQQGLATYASARAATRAAEINREKMAQEAQALKIREEAQKEAERHNKAQEDLTLRKPQLYTDPDTGEQHVITAKRGADGQVEFHDRNLATGATKALSGTPPSATAAEEPTAPKTGFDYRRGAPPVEKGQEAPEPMPVANRSAESLKTDAEQYVLTGKLPSVRTGMSPVAVRESIYKNTVQNYGNALAASRGFTPAQLAEAHRTAPGMLRFVMGVDGRATVSLGTAVRHLDTVQQLADAWKAGNIRVFNSIWARANKEFGGAEATNLTAAAKIVGPEIIKAIGVAGAGTAEERNAMETIMSPSASPQQIAGAINVMQRLLGGQLEGKQRQARAAGVSSEKFKDLIGDRPYEILSKAEAGHGAGAAAPQKTIKRQGKVNSGPNAGKTVIEYSDGTREYK